MPTCLGRPSDFKRTDRVIAQHKAVKQEVLVALQDLIEKSEGLVIQKIEDEMWATGGKMAGRVIVIGCGVASLILLSNPVGAAIGLAGTVIGYMVWGGSKVYEMRCEAGASTAIIGRDTGPSPPVQCTFHQHTIHTGGQVCIQ